VKRLVVIGAGGYAQEVFWVADDINAVSPTWELLGYIDPAAPVQKGRQHYDRLILGGWNDLPHGEQIYFACGIGSPAGRIKECAEAERRGLVPATLVHPGVTVARHVEIGEGTIVSAGCILSPYALIGRHCVLNHRAIVGHNSRIGDYCVLSPGATVLGNAELKDGVFVGANATVYLGRKVGAGSIVGANSFLLTHLGAGVSAIGVPAEKFAAADGSGICTAQESKKGRVAGG
jgi:sugar O-acyltransferase (sialic acid O-acetyltransferase NeuD family)